LNKKIRQLKLSLVVPVYNESETVDIFISEISHVFRNETFLKIEFIFINDGSTDNTLDKLLAHKKNHPCLIIVDLSRNFGKEAALTAGLQAATGDVIVPIDVDLQDPPELILDMIDKWHEGYEVVLGKRINRDSDSWAKRFSANWFYKIHNQISDPKLPENVGDFRLMDRKVVEAINDLPESRRFMKGLFAWAGFRTCYIEYARAERSAGKTKFSGWRLWNFALEGITSFSIVPLRNWTYLGLIVSLCSFSFAVIIVLKVLLQGIDVPGYASLMVAITFLGGLQLIGIGVLGEYLGRTYMESKRRPIFLVRQVYETEE